MRYIVAAVVALSALGIASAGAQSQGKFCLKQDKTGATNCSFQTMAACEQSKTGNTDQCMPNPGTTGSGSGRMPAGSGDSAK